MRRSVIVVVVLALVALSDAYLQQGKWEAEARRLSTVAKMRIPPTPLSDEEQKWMSGATKSTVNGWVQLAISGEPYARGFQHGQLMAEEFLAAYEAFAYFTIQTSGMSMEFFNELSVKIYADKIPAEYEAEMSGIADGLVKAGVNASYELVLGWNANMEIAGYYWPTIAGEYASTPRRVSNAHCSAFAATGSATPDGRPVLGHTTFIEFVLGEWYNVMLNVAPSEGFTMTFQTAPGYIASMTDFYISSAGLMVTETTLAGFNGFNVNGIPEFIRVRSATQYQSTIEGWIAAMQVGNNGGYANSWLLGSSVTGEIAEFEQGLTYTYTNIITDGVLFGDNVANDPQIRNLECSDTGFSDVRQQTGARRVRWPQLLDAHDGNITIDIGKTMLGDTFDVYLNKENPSSRCICGMYDVDPQYYVSDPNAVWNTPNWPAGSVDGKVASAASVETMTLEAIVGRANGVAFDASSFLAKYPAWNWQGPYLNSRPSQPWTTFTGNFSASA